MPGLIKLDVHAVFERICILGLGNMGGAFAKVLGPLIDMKKFKVTSPSLCNGTRSTPYPVALNNCDAAKDADLIFCSAKPKDVLAICDEISPVIKKTDAILNFSWLN